MFEVKMPQLGLTMESGEIGQWLKQVGDVVEVGDILCEIETDKITSELPSEHAGVLRAILAPVGEDVPVLGLLALIGDADEPLAVPGEAPPAAPEAAPDAEGTVAPVAAPAAVAQPGGRVRASGLAKKIAAERGVDLGELAGSGPGGRIVARDVEAAQVAAPEPAPQAVAAPEPAAAVAPASDDQRQPMSGMRKTIARRMLESWTSAPVVTYNASADMTALGELKATLLDEQGIKVSYTHMLAAMVSKALLEFPLVNCSIDGDALVLHDYVNLGIAVAVPDGLVVPVVRDADRKGMAALAGEITDLAGKAKNSELSPDALRGGTFTITNLAMFGIETFSPIVNLPEVAILGVGTSQPAPALVDGEIVFRSRMQLSLTADHRGVDGAVAAQFLSRVCALIEKPYLMMV